MADTPQVINTLRTKVDRLGSHIAILEGEMATSTPAEGRDAGR